MPLLLAPPKIKVYEAITAVLDGRVEVVSAGRAVVSSSAGGSTYTVTWSDDLASFGSSDKGTIFQGYIGYPIVAVILMIGLIDFDRDAVASLRGINWHELNAKFKRDYEKAIESVLDSMAGAERDAVVAEVDRVHAELIALKLERLAARKR